MISCVGPATAILPDVPSTDGTGRQRDPGPSASFDSQPDFRISLADIASGPKSSLRRGPIPSLPTRKPGKIRGRRAELRRDAKSKSAAGACQHAGIIGPHPASRTKEVAFSRASSEHRTDAKNPLKGGYLGASGPGQFRPAGGGRTRAFSESSRPDPFLTRDRRTPFSLCFRADHVAASLSPLHGPKAFCTTRPERIGGPAVGHSPSSAE